MVSSLTALFKLFIIILIIACLFFMIKKFCKRNLRGIIISVVVLAVLVILFFLPNYIKNLPIRAKELNYNESSNSKTLTIATEGAYYPWNYVTSSGNPEGFDVDIAKEIAKRMNLSPKFVIIPFQSLITNLSNKQYDMVVSSMSITDERSHNVDFSIPYVQVLVTFFGKKDIFSKYKNADLGTLKKVLKNKTIGTQSGTTWPLYLNKEFAEIIKVKYYATQPQLMMEVKSGRIDAGFSETPSVVEFIKENSNVVMFGPTLGIKDSPIFGKGIAVAVAKGNTELLDKINQALKSMHEDGTIKALSIKYFGTDISYGQ